MDNACAIERKCTDESLAHQANEHGVQPHLDHMRTHAHHNGPPLPLGRGKPGHQIRKIFACQLLRQGRHPLAQTHARLHGRGNIRQ